MKVLIIVCGQLDNKVMSLSGFPQVRHGTIQAAATRTADQLKRRVKSPMCYRYGAMREL